MSDATTNLGGYPIRWWGGLQLTGLSIDERHAEFFTLPRAAAGGSSCKLGEGKVKTLSGPGSPTLPGTEGESAIKVPDIYRSIDHFRTGGFIACRVSSSS
jgi:hypothetical protein